MPTRLAYATEVSRRLGGDQSVTVSIDPDTSDANAPRLIISKNLFDAEATAGAFGGRYVWVGRYGDSARIVRNSYAAVAKAVFTPPTSGTYTLTFYGYGTTSGVSFSASASTLQAAIQNISGLGSVTVSGPSAPYTIAYTSAAINIEASSGTLVTGFGSVQANRAFTSALPRGTTVQLSTKLARGDEDGLDGINTLINQALARLWTNDYLHLTSTQTNNLQVSFPLSTWPWIKTGAQFVSLYRPTRWKLVSVFTPPGSGTYTVSIALGGGTATTSSLAYNATAATVQTALGTAISALALSNGTGSVTVTGTSPLTVTVAETRFADPATSVTPSSGTVSVTNTISLLDQYARSQDGWRARFTTDGPTIEIDSAMLCGDTWLLEVYRPAYTRICPQTDWQTQGTVWQDSTIGLSADLDQASPDVESVGSFVHYLAARQLATRGPNQEVAYWQAEAQRAAGIAAQIKALDLPRDQHPGRSGLRRSSNITKGFVW